MRRSKRTTWAAAGALGIAGLGAAGIGAPALAAATTDQAGVRTSIISAEGAADETSDAEDRLADRTARLSEALAELVEDGTLTQEQADEVAATLAESDTLRGPGPAGGPRGPGAHLPLLETAAETLGLTEDELRAELADGATLADVADQEGVEVDDLVDDIVAAATAQIEERVDAGDLTQERADEITADLTERVTTMVEQGGPARDGEGGPRGRGPHGDLEEPEDDSTDTTASSFATTT